VGIGGELVANDTPFVPLPTPPASFYQPVKEADIRGHDFTPSGYPDYSTGYAAPSTDGDEYLRAIAYREHLVAMTRNKTAHLLALRGSRTAYAELQRKTLALTESAPPYIEADA
jgi:hypothetical protein